MSGSYGPRTSLLWDAPAPGFTVLGGYEWVPAREFLTLLEGRPEDFVCRSADGLQEWTAGEIRNLAATGQAIPVVRVLTHTGIWEVES